MHPLRELTLDDLRRRSSVKWATYDADVLPLWVAEMDVRPAASIRRVLTDVAERGDLGYPSGSPHYAEAVARFAEPEWGWAVDVAASATVADVMTGVVEMLRLTGGPGDPVVVNPPVYPPFYAYLRHARRPVVEAPLGPDGRLDLDALRETVADAGAPGRPVSYLLCSPHNPTAVVHTADELAAVAALAVERGVRVVVDEIHAPLAGPEFVPYLTVAGTDDAFAVHSASKAWNMPGIKAAVAFGGRATRDRFVGLSDAVTHGPSHVAVLAAVAAYDDGRDWLAGLRADLAENRTLLRSLLADRLPGVRWVGRGEGTYLAWLDLTALGLGDDPAAALLDTARVALVSGPAFSASEIGTGHARLNYGTTPEILTEAVDRIAAAH